MTVTFDLINARIRAAEQAMVANLNSSIYQGVPLPPISRNERAWRKLRAFFERAQDAWLVLRGKADIYG